MKSRKPTDEEIAQLLSFLPKLTVDGFEPVTRWRGGATTDGETATFLWPEYDEVVGEFVRVASKDCWCDRGYDPSKAGGMLADSNVVRNAGIEQIKTMLTFCIRGERFCDGHWAGVIKGGEIEMLLRRLAEITDTPLTPKV